MTKNSPALFLVATGYLLIPASPILATEGSTPRSVRPNVIVMMADDMGMGDTSAYQDFTGNADDVQLDTPQIERLARMGLRFTDAHTPSSRCSPTRYGLLTGRYPWRNRLKHWVLFGSQGDPMIEPERPTLATLFRDNGYATGMVGKWHVGLRYTRADGTPAAAWKDADLTKPLHTTPIDHGFDYARFTSRSHGTSGPDAGTKPDPTKKGRAGGKRNGPNQTVGPGHIHGRIAIAATDDGKELIDTGPKAYALTKLGSRHSDHAIEWLDEQVAAEKPFFLYYPSNSNHGPYTPDDQIGGVPVKGAARTKAGEPMDARHDYIYENDVALGRLLDYLEENDDPRNPGAKLIDNTIVIFTSDNGAEKNSNIATGPFRSHKGSTYEGGHRVPFLLAWPNGNVGDGDPDTPGTDNPSPVGHTDLFATFAEILDSPLPDLRKGEKGAEDSVSVLAAWQGDTLKNRAPLFFHDHKEAKDDPAVSALRLDSPVIDGKTWDGQWKIFFDASLLRAGTANPIELYELHEDQREKNNRLADPDLAPLVNHLTELALLHRNSGGHRTAEIAPAESITLTFPEGPLAKKIAGASAGKFTFTANPSDKKSATAVTISAAREDQPIDGATFATNDRGLGVAGGPGKFDQVENKEALLISFDRDVLVESVAIVAGNGQAGGFYTVGDHKPLAIYCVDASIDAKDQSSILSDIGLLKAGETLRLDSTPHYGTEAPGQWRLQALTFRPFPK
ncbi:MAG: arylsulfatase [Verrucomicrobiota bacterium]